MKHRVSLITVYKELCDANTVIFFRYAGEPLVGSSSPHLSGVVVISFIYGALRRVLLSVAYVFRAFSSNSIVFQFRVVTGTPSALSIWPRYAIVIMWRR
jgi:hypothetical protein